MATEVQVKTIPDYSSKIPLGGLTGKGMIWGSIITRFFERMEVKSFLNDASVIKEEVDVIAKEIKEHRLTDAMKDLNLLFSKANDLGLKFYDHIFNMCILLKTANIYSKKHLHKNVWDDYKKTEYPLLRGVEQMAQAIQKNIAGKTAVKGRIMQLFQSENVFAERFGIVNEVRNAYKEEKIVEKLKDDAEISRHLTEFLKDVRNSILRTMTIFQLSINRLLKEEEFVKRARVLMAIPQMTEHNAVHNFAVLLEFYGRIAHSIELMTNQLAGDLR